MRSIVKVTHTAIVEKKDPRREINRFLMNYRNTPHSTTGKTPSELLMNRIIKTKVPAWISTAQGKTHKEARNKEKEQKQRQKTYADKHRRAKERKVEVGDQLLIRQKKTTTSPPFNPSPYSVEEVKGTKITARRGKEIKTRNIEKWKVLKTRPAYLQKPQKEDLGVADEDDDEDDWLCYPTTGAASTGEPEGAGRGGAVVQ